jgi:hypothetical protein
VYTLAGLKRDIDACTVMQGKKTRELIRFKNMIFGPEFRIGFQFLPQLYLLAEIKISNGLKNVIFMPSDETAILKVCLIKIQSRMIVFSIHLEG